MRKLLVLALVSALALVACGGGGATAITINGEATTVAEIDAMFIRPEPVTKERFANDLTFYVHWKILPAAAREKWGIDFTEAEIEAEAQVVIAQFAQPGETREAFLAARNLTELYLQRYAHVQLVDRAVSDKLLEGIERVDPELDEEAMDVARGELAEVCASHILAKDLRGIPEGELEEARADALAQANDLIDRIKAGESFEELAAEYGTDGTAQRGGDLGCLIAVRVPPESYVEPFATAILYAPIGVVADEPVDSPFGFHVIKVRERTSDEDVVELYIDRAVNAEIQNQFRDWFFGVLIDTDVQVNERFGTWVTVPEPGVIPPLT